jgi:tetratricopeptide (TPR) repeat protein
MDDELKIRLNKLHSICCDAFEGEPIDAQWLFDEAHWLMDSRPPHARLEYWRVIVEAGRAVNHLGEYALGGELFEEIIETARKIRFPRLEFDALEGLAFSWFYLGDRTRAVKYLEYGLEIATKLDRPIAADRFKVRIEKYRSGEPSFPDNLKALPIRQSVRANRCTYQHC